MNQAQAVVRVRRPRRSAAEILELVKEFHASGSTQTEFCQRRGVVRTTLNRYLNKHRKTSHATGGLVAVEVAGPLPLWREAEKALAIILPTGRKLEVGVGFDAATLTRIIAVLERM